MNVVSKTDLKDVKLIKRGKVRDIYEVDDKLLIVSTDRISAFDIVLPNAIPMKGKILNKMCEFWFKFTCDICDNHFITADVEDFPDILKKYSLILKDRAMLCLRAEPIMVECIVRGYLSGSAWKEYKKKGTIWGTRYPDGLKESQKLDEPIFTPTTKALEGHDEPITFKKLKDKYGTEIANFLKDKSIEIYLKGAKYAEDRDIIIADAKFEFGFYDDRIILIDEILTPDSSRFWDAKEYSPGLPQKSFDKQFVRDYLESIGWNKKPPPPPLPPEIIKKTTEKYKEAYKRLVGEEI